MELIQNNLVGQMGEPETPFRLWITEYFHTSAFRYRFFLKNIIDEWKKIVAGYADKPVEVAYECFRRIPVPPPPVYPGGKDSVSKEDIEWYRKINKPDYENALLEARREIDEFRD